MAQVKKIEEIISLVLTIGVLISIALVLLGGCMYLWQVGSRPINLELLQTADHATNMQIIWHSALSFSPVGLIELGLLTLVGTQIMRVFLLVWYYSAIHDFLFAFISLFILLTLIYSLIWRS